MTRTTKGAGAETWGLRLAGYQTRDTSASRRHLIHSGRGLPVLTTGYLGSSRWARLLRFWLSSGQSVTDGHVRDHNFRRRVFNPALAAASAEHPEFPHIAPHDLRHTAASLAVSAGANVKAVQRMLGHVSAAMTLDAYADLFDEDLNTVSNAVDREAAAHFTGWAAPSAPDARGLD